MPIKKSLSDGTSVLDTVPVAGHRYKAARVEALGFRVLGVGCEL